LYRAEEPSISEKLQCHIDVRQSHGTHGLILFFKRREMRGDAQDLEYDPTAISEILFVSHDFLLSGSRDDFANRRIFRPRLRTSIR
jgi:hypothetical protein